MGDLSAKQLANRMATLSKFLRTLNGYDLGALQAASDNNAWELNFRKITTDLTIDFTGTYMRRRRIDQSQLKATIRMMDIDRLGTLLKSICERNIFYFQELMGIKAANDT